jgi:multidrug efflux pump subunit AcrA (membrane-fusion protein)
MGLGKGARRLYVIVLVWLVAATAGVGLLASRRSSASRREIAARTQERDVGPRVLVAAATATPAKRSLRLQGEVHPFSNVTLYAKVAGYLGSVRVDKGDHVSAGQIVAHIVSPELTQQLAGARADAVNKRRQAARLQALGKPGVVSAQDVETASSSADVAEATAASLRDQTAYRILRAPFDGTVTERFADPGIHRRRERRQRAAGVLLRGGYGVAGVGHSLCHHGEREAGRRDGHQRDRRTVQRFPVWCGIR